MLKYTPPEIPNNDLLEVYEIATDWDLPPKANGAHDQRILLQMAGIDPKTIKGSLFVRAKEVLKQAQDAIKDAGLTPEERRVLKLLSDYRRIPEKEAKERFYLRRKKDFIEEAILGLPRSDRVEKQVQRFINLEARVNHKPVQLSLF